MGGMIKSKKTVEMDKQLYCLKTLYVLRHVTRKSKPEMPLTVEMCEKFIKEYSASPSDYTEYIDDVGRYICGAVDKSRSMDSFNQNEIAHAMLYMLESTFAADSVDATWVKRMMELILLPESSWYNNCVIESEAKSSDKFLLNTMLENAKRIYDSSK